MGDLSESLVEVKTHNEKASTAQDSALAVGVKQKGQYPDDITVHSPLTETGIKKDFEVYITF